MVDVAGLHGGLAALDEGTGVGVARVAADVPRLRHRALASHAHAPPPGWATAAAAETLAADILDYGWSDALSDESLRKLIVSPARPCPSLV